MALSITLQKQGQRGRRLVHAVQTYFPCCLAGPVACTRSRRGKEIARPRPGVAVDVVRDDDGVALS